MKTKKEIEELLEALRAGSIDRVETAKALGFGDIEWSNPNAVGSVIETLEWVLEKG